SSSNETCKTSSTSEQSEVLALQTEIFTDRPKEVSFKAHIPQISIVRSETEIPVEKPHVDAQALPIVSDVFPIYEETVKEKFVNQEESIHEEITRPNSEQILGSEPVIKGNRDSETSVGVTESIIPKFKALAAKAVTQAEVASVELQPLSTLVIASPSAAAATKLPEEPNIKEPQHSTIVGEQKETTASSISDITVEINKIPVIPVTSLSKATVTSQVQAVSAFPKSTRIVEQIPVSEVEELCLFDHQESIEVEKTVNSGSSVDIFAAHQTDYIKEVPVMKPKTSETLEESTPAFTSNDQYEISASDGSEEAASPCSSETDSELVQSLPKGIFNDPDNDIVEDAPEVLDGKTIPRVLVPDDLWAEAVEKDTWRETFYVPASMGGVLIGRFGKNVRELKSQWNAEFSLNMCPGRQDTLLLKLSCPVEHKENVLHWISGRFKMRPSQTTIGNPNQLRRLLPLGHFTQIQVRSLYGLKEFFVTIKDSEYSRYLAMQEELDKDYASLSSSRMQLYEPVTSGTVAILPHSYGFARALILKVLLTWPRQAVCFMLDHGTFGVIGLSELRKIKAKYMRVPFQAIHVSWAHALPIYSDVPDLHILRTFFSGDKTVAFPVRMETCCRASVALLDYQPPQSTTDQPTYSDLLALACRSGLYVAAPLGIFPDRQTWLNRTDRPYYPCPYSDIAYKQLVEYYPEESLPSNSGLQSQQQSKQHKGMGQLQTRTGRGGGSYRRSHHHSHNRRFRKNSHRTNNSNNFHNGQTKREQLAAAKG
ncbi:unnamed protein product, partial [Mesocestoides corti]